MPQTSPIMNLPYIEPSQAQKHVTHNEALRILDAVTQLSVLSADLATPPATPAEGDRYIVASSATAGWAGQDGHIAVWTDNTWQFFAPQTGWRADVTPTGATLRFDGSTWGAATDVSVVPEIGVNTSADATNKLAVASDATLFTHNGAGHQIKVNKDSAGDTASLLFQTSWSGRAEMGTAGSDDFAIKVSPDGGTFYTALQIDAASGKVSFPQGGAREQLSANRDYYVRLDGNDANDGQSDSAGGAFRTIQHAVDTLLGLDCGIHDVTLNVGPGNYAETVSVSGAVLGSGSYSLSGNTTTPTNVQTTKIICDTGAVLSVEGFELTAANGLTVHSDAKIKADHLRFSGTGAAMDIRHAYVDCNYADLSFAASISTIATMYNYAYLSAFSAQFTLDGGIDWGASGAFYLQSFCLTWLQSASFVGTATGKRYVAAINSAINTNGEAVDFIPGDSAGSTATGSIYA